MVNYPSDFIKSWGYNNLLNLYASQISTRAKVDIIYHPGLRKLAISPDKIKIQSVIPGDHNDYGKEMQRFITGNAQAMVECSGMDAWHTYGVGTRSLSKLRAKGYRVVIFDGGHHLPTLGLSPDIIIIPQMAGYAVHAKTLDGIKANTIKEMAADIHSHTVIATVPRWALVKNRRSLNIITHKVLKACYYKNNVTEPLQPDCCPGLSKSRGVIFAYVNRYYAGDLYNFIKNGELIGLNDVRKIYLAFDYNYLSKPQAEQYTEKLHQILKVPVIRVNEPVKTFNVLFQGGR